MADTEMLQVLRGVWEADPKTRDEVDDACGPTKTCRNMAHVSFDGYAEPGSDLGSAWRAKLEREGKLGRSSLADLIASKSDVDPRA